MLGYQAGHYGHRSLPAVPVLPGGTGLLQMRRHAAVPEQPHWLAAGGSSGGVMSHPYNVKEHCNTTFNAMYHPYF